MLVEGTRHSHIVIWFGAEMSLDVIQENDRIKKPLQPPSCNMGHIGVAILETPKSGFGPRTASSLKTSSSLVSGPFVGAFERGKHFCRSSKTISWIRLNCFIQYCDQRLGNTPSMFTPADFTR
jgi:hypothetical protein